MPEIQNREALEEEFARKFGKVARRHMLEYRKLLGDPPSDKNVPDEFFEKMQHESEDELYPLLFGIFVASAETHGWLDAASSLAAFGWAKQRSEEIAEHWSESVRSKLDKGFAELAEPEPHDESTIELARQASQVQTRSEPHEPTKEEIDELMRQVFAPHRIITTAVDEVTRASHAGGESAIEETVGVSELDEWRCKESAVGVPDDKVCPVCFPMNRVPRRDWPWRLNAGPPCHPNDRCRVEYARLPAIEAVSRMLDDPDFE